jgi:hypothetical protein
MTIRCFAPAFPHAVLATNARLEAGGAQRLLSETEALQTLQRDHGTNLVLVLLSTSTCVATDGFSTR